jgi:tRNA threonylcarbamoyladenosine modification (KEOPS) complex  Pcc1 subunit
MAVKAKASICLKFCDPKHLATAVTALQPEVNSPVTHRTNVVLQTHNCFLVLNITADDTVALRAIINTYLRWIISAVKIMEIIEYI